MADIRRPCAVLHRCDEGVSASGNVGDEGWCLFGVFQCPAQGGYMHPQIGFFDKGVGPDMLDDIGIGAQFTGMACQIKQDIHGSAAYGHSFSVTQKSAPGRQDREGAE